MAFKPVAPKVATNPWDGKPPYHPRTLGWRPDIDDEHYFRSHAYVSSHKIMSWVKDPDGKAEKSNIPSKALEMGTMLHALVLNTPEEAEEIIKLRCTSLSQSSRQQALMMAKAVKGNRSAAAALDPCQKELAGYYRGLGISVRIKCDAINTETKVIYDVKTTSDIRNFKSSIKSFLYGVQAAFYLQAANLIEDTPNAYTRFIWIIVDKRDGKVQLVECPKSELIQGNNHIQDYFNRNFPGEASWPDFLIPAKKKGAKK